MTQDEINRLLVDHAQRGPSRRAAEGRRSVRVRSRRRGGGGARRGRRALRGRAGRDRRRRGARVRGHPGHTPRRSLGRGLRDRARGPGQGRERDRLGRAGRLPRHARLLHGRARAARSDRRAAAPRPRRRTSRRRSSSAAPCRASAPCPGTLADIAERARRGARAAAGGDGRRPGRGAARAPRLVRAGARCTGSASPSPARAPRPAGSRPTCERLGAEVVRGAGDPDRAPHRHGRRAAHDAPRWPRRSSRCCA